MTHGKHSATLLHSGDVSGIQKRRLKVKKMTWREERSQHTECTHTLTYLGGEKCEKEAHRFRCPSSRTNFLEEKNAQLSLEVDRWTTAVYVLREPGRSRDDDWLRRRISKRPRAIR